MLWEGKNPKNSPKNNLTEDFPPPVCVNIYENTADLIEFGSHQFCACCVHPLHDYNLSEKKRNVEMKIGL